MQTQVRTQSRQFAVLPQQIQLLKLFHLTGQQLQQRIQDELDENPLLEEDNDQIEDNAVVTEPPPTQEYQDEDEYRYDDIPDYKLEHKNYLSDNDLPQQPIVEKYDFRHDLKEQVSTSLKTKIEIDLANYIIDSVNDSGLLDQTLEVLADDYSFSQYCNIDLTLFENIRRKIMELEPGGIGCFTVTEFLLFQMHKMKPETAELKQAITLLEKCAASLKSKNPLNIKDLVNINSSEFQAVLKLIRTCKSKPVTEIDSTNTHASVIPDFIIREAENGFEISLQFQRSATLFINKSTSKFITGCSAHTNNVHYVKSKRSAAQWFVDAIKQREETMQKVMKMIVEIQYDYFLDGDEELLKPMILKDVADKVGHDISTISRITCNKYADTHFGVIPLKSLFSEGIVNETGKNVSNRVIQSVLADIVKSEDTEKPFTDLQLVKLLSEKGFSLARRTVAKYRDQLKIPSAQFRSAWSS